MISGATVVEAPDVLTTSTVFAASREFAGLAAFAESARGSSESTEATDGQNTAAATAMARRATATNGQRARSHLPISST
jgi:hypothetical protein